MRLRPHVSSMCQDDGESERDAVRSVPGIEPIHPRNRGGRWTAAGTVSTLAILWLTAVAIGAPLRGAGFHVPRPWGAPQGVNLSMANAVTQTTDGYLWVGSPAGLYRFNGVDFITVDPRPPDATGQMALHVTALCADRAGGLWIGGLTDGLFYHHQGRSTAFGSQQGLTNERIKAVFEDRDGVVWVATDGGGAFRRVGDRFEPLAFENGEAPMHPTAFAQDDAGRIWMGTHNNGVYRFRDQHLDDIVEPKPTVTAMTKTPDGVIWIATSAALTRVIDDRLEPVPLPQPDGSVARRTYVTSVTADHEGTLWVGTLTGLIRLQGNVSERFEREDGLGNGLVTCLFADREGSVWAGVEIGDLYQLRRSQIKMLEPFAGRLQAVNTLCEDSTGRLWVGGSSGLVAFHAGSLLWTPPPGNLAAEEIAAVGEDLTGRIWFATRFGDWGWWQDGVVQRFPLGDTQSPRARVNFFFRTRAGQLWAGSHGGLLQLQPDQSLAQFASIQLPHSQPLSACEDAEGAVWVGTGHGLNRFYQGTLETYIHLEPRSIEVVTALHADEDGTVWIGTDRGLWRHRSGQFFAFGTEHGAPPTVGQILEDPSGYLWLSLGERMARIPKTQLHAVADGKADRVESRSYARSAGLTSVLVSSGARAVKTREGWLALATDHGVAIVDPVDPPRINTPPPVIIERVVLNGEPVSTAGPAATASAAAGPLVLAPGYNLLEIHYASLTFLAPDRVRFRHRLRGLSDEWEPDTASRVAQFRALPPGRYEFEVTTTQAHRDGNQPPVGLKIRVLAPWWHAAWLKAAVGALLLAALGTGYVLRIRRLEQLNEARRDFSMRLLEREESERRRLSRELHDGLGQDLLVLKNQATLLGQRLPPDREDLQRSARELAETSQTAVDGARTIAYNLRPADLDRAGLKRSLQAMLDRAAASSAVAIDHSLEDLDGSLSAQAEVMLYRVTQELINNTLKHAHASRVFVDLRLATNNIELVVSDDGCGFDPAIVRGRAGPTKGLGLDSVDERVAMLNGELRMESAPGQGTRFLVRIPLPPLSEARRNSDADSADPGLIPG